MQKILCEVCEGCEGCKWKAAFFEASEGGADEVIERILRNNGLLECNEEDDE